VETLSIVSILLLTAAAAAPSPDGVCVACRADLAQIRVDYSVDEWTTLTRGEIVTTNARTATAGGSTHGDVNTAAIVSYTPTQVWSVLTDFEARPRFIPTMRESHITRTERNRTWVAEWLRVLWVNVHLQVIDTLDPEAGTIRWVLDKNAKHDITDTIGSWQIAAVSEGRTYAGYRNWVDTGRPVPYFVENLLTQHTLPKVIEGLQAELVRRYGD